MVLTEQKHTIWNVSVQRRCHFSFGLRPTWSFETLDGQIPRHKNQQVAQMEELESPCSWWIDKICFIYVVDPEYGLPATKALEKDAGLLLAYEKTGYDTSSTKRLPDCLNLWSAKRIKEQGADAVKFLLLLWCRQCRWTQPRKTSLYRSASVLNRCWRYSILPWNLGLWWRNCRCNLCWICESVNPRKVIEAMKVSQILVSISMFRKWKFQLMWTSWKDWRRRSVYSREEAAALQRTRRSNQPSIHLPQCRCIS